MSSVELDDPEEMDLEQRLPEGRKGNLPEVRKTNRRMKRPRLGVKGKKRGQNRHSQTLGGIKKQERALKRKVRNKMNRIGKAGFPGR